MNTESVCIGYLTDERRMYTFETFIMFLNKLQNKNKIHLLMLINGNSVYFFENVIKLKLQGVKYTILVFDNHNNYIRKIQSFIAFTKHNNIKYCMKFDNDLIINNHLIDYMIDNLHLLENKDNLYITPTLSSGIPTTDYFIEDFFDETERLNMHKLFLKTYMPTELWGFNYSELNHHTIYTHEWNVEKFITNLNKMDCYYKGIHPIRINKECIEYMNKVLIKYKNKIFDKQDYKMQVDDNPSYLCNSVFIIDVNNYDKLVHNTELYVDPFDEVPVNKYCKLNNLKGVIVRNSFSVHPIYNTIPNFANMEREFHEEFMRQTA